MAITNLNLASDVAIRAALVRLKTNYSANNSWVPSTNKYVVDTLTEIYNDTRPGQSINSPHMVDYIAASSMIHCFNSWSYFTAAINAFLEGDYGTAVHNAYYSELRSIMSFLASQGIGVFGGISIIVDQNGVATKAVTNDPSNEKGTHNFAKAAFDQWLVNPTNTSKLLKLIKVKGLPIEDWFFEAGFSPAYAGASASRFLTNWSLDINILNQEHDLRNFVSYRPQNFNPSIARPSDDIKERLKVVMDIWELCSPGRLFEISILRKSFDDLNFASHAKKYSDEPEATIQALLTKMGISPSDLNGKYLVNFFKRVQNPTDNNLFDKATSAIASNPISEVDTDPIGILSRACLLLLTNTNINESILKITTTSRNDLNFWHNNIGIKLGYWEIGDAPTLFADMWLDIEEDIKEVNKWIKPAIAQSVHSFKNDLKGNSTYLRQLNKSYFWNTGS